MPKSLEDVIRERGYFMIKPKGTSMFPMIRKNCDNICVIKAKLPLKKHDVALYKRGNGHYVLHRVLDIDEDGYVLCGDNQWVLERGITGDMIIGVLDSWYTGEKKHTVTDKGYLKYVKFWCRSLKLRHFILYFCHILLMGNYFKRD